MRRSDIQKYKTPEFPQIIDANLSRVSEGLRVIEEYCRFVAGHKTHASRLASLRKAVYKIAKQSTPAQQLQSRNTKKDMRAVEPPIQRSDLADLLTANFKRASEGLRVLEEYTGNPAFNKLRYEIYDLEKDIVLTLLKPTIRKGIYLISDDPDVLEKGLKWGVALIQLRAKDKSKQQVLKLATQIKKVAKNYDIPFIIND